MARRKVFGLGFMAMATLVAVIALSGCSSMMGRMRGVTKPSPNEFGLGPRSSAHGLYTATLQPSESLRPRKLQSVRVALKDADGHAVDGVYVIDGVRFNMGGWWEFRLSIQGKAGADQVTFNLAL